VTVTIPEGFKMHQLFLRLEENGVCSYNDLMEAAESNEYNYSFLDESEGEGAYRLEGFLFPKTYEISKEDTADSLVRKMLDQYKLETAGIDYSYAESKNLTEYDVLILASIVERESAADVRAEVSSVFYNRLSGGMQLQSDATTAYLVNGDPTPEDLENTAENPYNTQYNYGLPPGPICSPSLESIEAAAHPADTNYLYFFFQQDENGDMQYYFSVDYDQHQAAINGEGTPYKAGSAEPAKVESSSSSAEADDAPAEEAPADEGGEEAGGE
jgi:UPF0755 protein